MKDLIKDNHADDFMDNFKVAIDEQLLKPNIIIIPLKTSKPTVRIVKIRVNQDHYSGRRSGYRCIVLVDDIYDIILILYIYTHKDKDNISEVDKKNYKMVGSAYLLAMK